MQKTLQLAAFLGATLATFFFPMAYLHAQSEAPGSIASSTDATGRKVYVNDFVSQPSVKHSRTSASRDSGLVYWSVTDHRWKPVPAANVRAARSAASEVNRILARRKAQNANASISFAAAPSTFSEQEVNAAIDRAALLHNVDPSLVRAVIKVESNFNPNAVSKKGAMGLMQLMPQTARQLNVTNPFDPQQNVDAGVRHLKHLMESYGGDVNLTLAAYNAGAGAVARSAGVPNFAETRNYVKRITNLYYGGPGTLTRNLRTPVYSPVHMQRDARGVLYMSNTD